MRCKGNQLEDVLAFAEQQQANGFQLDYGPVRHNSEPPLGDGETGGNVACYLYDPDWHNVEFCGAMDTIETIARDTGTAKAKTGLPRSDPSKGADRHRAAFETALPKKGNKW